MNKQQKDDNSLRIEQQIDKLRKQIHSMKKNKNATNSTDFLHASEFSLMKQISYHNQQNNTSPTLVMLSNSLGITQATVTPLVDKLVAKELLIKEVSPTDKRAKLISLTPKGEEYLQHNLQFEYDRLHSLLEHLGDDDTNELIRILDKVIDHFVN